MKQEIECLLKIIKYILNKKTGELFFLDGDINWNELCKIAKQHGIIHLVYYGVECLSAEKKPNEEVSQYLYKCLMSEIVRSCNQIAAADELLDVFEKEGIYALAVKGISTKRLYPESDMRSMGDIDILYQHTQQKKLKMIMSKLGYGKGEEGRKHDTYFRKPYINVEMHRELVATDSIYSKYYENIWSRLELQENSKYIYEMTREDAYIYTIIHLVEHFKSGGISIRFIMDIYVYDSLKGMKWNYIQTQLEELGLWEFYVHISRLAQIWFGKEAEYTDEEKEILDQLATYIATNGTFGMRKNIMPLSESKKGKNHFLLSALFPNLKNMQSMFPWLKKYPILLPYSWIIRGVRSIMFRRRHIRTQVNRYKYWDDDYRKELTKFFESCGL